MEIKVLFNKENKLNFIIKDIDTTFANTLRRIMTVEVPVLAIEEVNFLKNTSALYDEIIAHRLGLIPIKTDLKSYNLKEKCKCKSAGCSLCQLNINLKAKGPCIVYASELKPQDPEIKPIYPNMPIVKLLKGQKLEFEAVAVLGQGKQHIKFSPCLAYYRTYPDIKIKNVKNEKEIVEICPKKVFKIEDNKLKITNLENCDLCNACVDESKEQIEVKPEKDKFIFHIESWGQLDPKEIFLESLNILEDKLNEFEKKLKKAK